MATSDTTFFDPRMAIGTAVPAEPSDPRLSPEFEALEAEIHKLESEGPARVAWDEIVRLSLALLATRGKDLLVGCWLAHALLRREHDRGLAVGLGILRGMVETHWETMQPPPSRERARARALEWFADRSSPLCEAEPAEADGEAVAYADEALDAIERLAAAKQPDVPPQLGHLARILRSRAKAARAERAERERREREQVVALPGTMAAPAEEEREPERPAPPVAEPAHPPAGPVFDPAFPDTLPETLRTVSTALIERNPADPLGHTLSRVASWWRLRRLPPNVGGRTIAAPPVEEAATVRSLIEQGRTTEALVALNDLVWTAPFWFEGHRLAAGLLADLGPDHADAQACIGGMVALLMRRLPALMDFTFTDGSPLVDPATRDWLGEIGAGAASGPVDPLERIQAEARSLVAAGRGQDAIQLVAGLTGHDVTGRARFRRQVVQARLCLDLGLIAMALPLLDHLDTLMDAYRLDSWEPALAAEVAELRVRALTHSEAPRLIAEDRRRTCLEAARRRLAGLDLAAASHLFR